nr:DUF1616 domain-containing protein [uncultured Methanospirillum sp.]
MINTETFRTDSLFRIPELILFSGMIICLLGLLGIITPVLYPAAPVAGLLCGFWLSGYAVMTILFPYTASGERVVTVIGSILSSITFLTLSALACEFSGKDAFSDSPVPQVTPFFTSIILLYSTFFVLMALIVVFSRSDRTTIPEFFIEAGSGLKSRIPPILAAAALILLFCGAAAWILSATEPREVTEVWLFNANGTAENYPSSVHTGEKLTSIIGIHSQERGNTTFILTTSVQNRTVNSRTLGLAEGEKAEFPVTIDQVSGTPGETVRIRYDLFRGDNQNTTPYRSVSEGIRIL